MRPVEIFTGEIQAWADDPTGPVGAALMVVATERVIPDAVTALSVDAPFTTGGPNNSWKIYERNTTGVPRRRSGDMISNLAVTAPMIYYEKGGLAVYGTSEAVHGGYNYWIILRDGLNPNIPGYYRVFKDNPYYTYDGIPS